jgi:PilZ domain-containing protein
LTALVPTLPLGQHVVVRLPDAGALPATVVAADGELLTLILPVADERLNELGGTEITVEWTYGLGYRRCAGTVRPGSGRRELLNVALSGDVVCVQRRRWARTDAVLPVRVSLVDQPGAGWDTTTVNVSGGGLLLDDPWRLRVGVDLWLELELDPAEPGIRALAQVVRRAEVRRTGVRFVDVLPEDEERIVRYVDGIERARLERELGFPTAI